MYLDRGRYHLAVAGGHAVGSPDAPEEQYVYSLASLNTQRSSGARCALHAAPTERKTQPIRGYKHLAPSEQGIPNNAKRCKARYRFYLKLKRNWSTGK